MDLAPRTFQHLAAIIRHESGIVLGLDKSYLVRHRLEPLIREQELESFDTLVTRLHLRSSSSLRSAVIDAITVKETRFFRDQACFDGMRKHVLPELARKNPGKGFAHHRIRIWSAAAATGQEAYSLAMLTREFTTTECDDLNEKQFAIFGSDISAAAIEFAKAGCFTTAEVRRGLSDARLREHFHHRDEYWKINDDLRRLVQFRKFNLLDSPSDLGPFDLILCRNVLIYFDDPTRRQICKRLYAALQPGGWLVLGSAESLYGMEDRFETLIHGRCILYRKPQD